MQACGNKLFLVVWLLCQVFGFAHPVSFLAADSDVTGTFLLPQIQTATSEYDGDVNLSMGYDLALPSTTMVILGRSNEPRQTTLAYRAVADCIFFVNVLPRSPPVEKAAGLAAEAVASAGLARLRTAAWEL